MIDFGGRSILPGFINAHVQTGFEADNLTAWAQAGVTTVRDVGARPVLPRSWDEWLAASDEAGIKDAAHMVTDRLPDELIDEMIARDVHVVLTLAMLEAYGGLGEGLENVRRFLPAPPLDRKVGLVFLAQHGSVPLDLQRFV